MCGIVGAVAQRHVMPILLEGLKRLEYRGYDSAGLAILNDETTYIERVRALGKVDNLRQALSTPLKGYTGIGHTRWATHGKPSEQNAHPLMSGDDFALVHNGIIENHEELKNQLISQGYQFTSETDTEVIAHLIHFHYKETQDLVMATRSAVNNLRGAFAFVLLHKASPGRLIAARQGSPLVIGIGIEEYFVASDQLALLSVAQEFIYLKKGDIADISMNQLVIYDENHQQATRTIHRLAIHSDAVDRGQYRHYMMKEIFEQPNAIAATLEDRLNKTGLYENIFGENAVALFKQVKCVQIVACGTSYHAGLVARHWIEELAGIPCQVEMASEMQYRSLAVQADTLFVTLSQSGETADTLAALNKAKKLNYLSSLAICNVPESSIVRESDFVFMMRAGTEIGVASTKAFTAQLVSLLMLTISLGRHHHLTPEREKNLIAQLNNLPGQIDKVLLLNDQVRELSIYFSDKQHALFLGRGLHYPIAMEGALKLKEISYIHAEAYAAGELKHGPLALIDENMPVIAILPNNHLLEKTKSNLNEILARGGRLFVFADESIQLQSSSHLTVLNIPDALTEVSPIIHTIPLQLLAYHVAVLKGTDVDQPRNLAKSVTVE